MQARDELQRDLALVAPTDGAVVVGYSIGSTVTWTFTRVPAAESSLAS